MNTISSCAQPLLSQVWICLTVIPSSLRPRISLVYLNYINCVAAWDDSKRQAYAYLLVNQTIGITDKARKRLSSIRQINNFGAGFRIALRDLELRGAGNLLGSEQSGHVAGIGFEMYCKLLKESVSRLKGDEVSLRPAAAVRIDFLSNDYNETDSADLAGYHIPESYIMESRLRIDAYRILASSVTIEGIDAYEDELRDRFGPPPEQVEALLLEARIRCLAEEASFDLVETKGTELFLRFAKKGPRASVPITGLQDDYHD